MRRGALVALARFLAESLGEQGYVAAAEDAAGLADALDNHGEASRRDARAYVQARARTLLVVAAAAGCGKDA